MSNIFAYIGGRKFAMAMLVIAIIVLDNKFNLLGLDAKVKVNALLAILETAIVYITGESIADTVSRFKNPQPKK